MTEAGWAALQRHLLTRYAVFKKRLTKYLGSADLAGDILQDMWLRLARGGELSTVRSPDNYLYSMAVNIARNHIHAENRRLLASEIGTLLDIEDEAPSPLREVEARSELEALVVIIAELPQRQRAILLAARVDGMRRQEIARRFGVSVRYVQRELHEAQVYCVERMRTLSKNSFTLPGRELSTEQKNPSWRSGRGKIAEE